MRILICGGREYSNKEFVWSVLDSHLYHEGISLIINGGAGGADWLARKWCYEREVDCMTYRAQFSKLGKPAGPIRNKRMAAEGKPDLVIAFPGGKGTANMTSIAKAATIKVIDYDNSRDSDNQ